MGRVKVGVEGGGEVTGVTRETNRDVHQLLHWLYTDGYSRRKINVTNIICKQTQLYLRDYVEHRQSV